MRPGVFAKTFAGDSLESCLDRVVAADVRAIQFNMALAGGPSLPDAVPSALTTRIRERVRERGLEMVAVSGTYNMAHPDPGVRRRGLTALRALVTAAHGLETRVVTLCTGSRDPNDMWHRHTDNDTAEAWADLLESVAGAAEVAERHGVVLAFEPEHGTVVNDASAARRLLDAVGSTHLKVVVDAANLILPGELDHQAATLERAFELFGAGPRARARQGPPRRRHHRRRRARKPGLRAVRTAAAPGRVHRCPGPARPAAGRGPRERGVRDGAAARRDRRDRLMPEMRRGTLRFAYRDAGSGPAFVFQHGLGADAGQPASLAPRGYRLITLECRGHGGTSLGPPDELGFETLARDLDTLLDELRLSRVVLGGVSMGAGVALTLARLRPHRARALVLVRPAWLDRARPPNLQVFPEIAALLRRHGPVRGKEIFMAESHAYRHAHAVSPALARSLAGQFDRPHAGERAAVLE